MYPHLFVLSDLHKSNVDKNPAENFWIHNTMLMLNRRNVNIKCRTSLLNILLFDWVNTLIMKIVISIINPCCIIDEAICILYQVVSRSKRITVHCKIILYCTRQKELLYTVK